MRRATENQGNTRTLSEYFSPRSKVKDFALQERSLHHFMSFAQETPMKPSQVPNQLPHPPPRRMLPLQSPEVCHRDRLGPSRHPPHHLGPVHSSGFVPSRPANIISSGSSPNRPNLVPHVRLGHSAQPAGSFCPRPAPVSPTNSGPTAKQSQPVSPSIVCPATSHPRREKVTEPKVTPSCTGTKNDQRRKSTTSSEKLMPVPTVNLDHTSQKRHMDFEDCQDRAKKLCVDGANSGKAQTPKPAVRNSHSTSLASQPSPQQSSASEPKPTKAADGRQSAYLELSTSKPAEPPCASLSSCVKGRPAMGAKQAFVRMVNFDSVPSEEEQSCGRTSRENDGREKPSAAPHKDTGDAPDFQSSNHHSGHSHRSSSVLPARTPSRGNHVQESRKAIDGSTHKSPVSCHTAERNKGARPRKPAVIPDDIAELFTPDPFTLVNPGHKTVKPKTDAGPIKSPTSEKSCSSTAVSGSSTAVSSSSCRKTHCHNVTAASSNAFVSSVSPACHKQFLQPTVALERVKLENLRYFSPKDSSLNKNGPSTSSGRQNKDEAVKSNDKRASLPPNTARPRAVEKDATSEQTPSSHRSIVLERPPSEQRRRQTNEDVFIDELDIDLSLPLDVDLTQSSHSSDEEEQLPSLQELMERAAVPPDSQERGTFSAPSTPGSHSCHSKTLLPSTTKSGVYRNNLDQMLKEINNNKKAKEMETKLLNTCKENLMRIGEYEEAVEEGNLEEGISAEHQEFLQRYSLMSSAIKEVPPGEVVFNLEKFGRIFNHDTLQLRQCRVKPNGMAQKTLLWSSPAHLRWHVTNGLFQEAYNFRSPCPAKITRFLFKMMSVHEERLVSERILKVLCDIAITAAHQIVKNGGQHFEVWVPSLADVVLVLMNMGAAFVTLFPSENLQPPFTEGNLLDDIVLNETPSDKGEQRSFPEHNCSNIFKYLSYCMCLCPRAYSDDELMLLLTVVGRVCMDTRLILQPSLDLYPLLFKLINNFRDWDTMLPKICLAFTDMTNDHHNMCLLVQLLPDNTRGKQLRRHLSLSMISKLLDGRCTYRPTEKEIQLSDLRPYLPRIKPSTLVRGMMSSSSRSHKDKDMTSLDQQAYYLCYSLLTLTNEASNFQFFSANQKEQLLFLSSEMETHIKCDIRESEKCLYRSKVKDLVARIYTKWQMLLQRTRPLHGKLYDYWQPCLPIDLTSSQDESEMDNTDEGEVSVTNDGGGESSTTEEKDVTKIIENQEEGDILMDDGSENKLDAKAQAAEGQDTMDDRVETAEAIGVIQGELSREVLEMEMEVDA